MAEQKKDLTEALAPKMEEYLWKAGEEFMAQDFSSKATVTRTPKAGSQSRRSTRTASSEHLAEERETTAMPKRQETLQPSGPPEMTSLTPEERLKVGRALETNSGAQPQAEQEMLRALPDGWKKELGMFDSVEEAYQLAKERGVVRSTEPASSPSTSSPTGDTSTRSRKARKPGSGA